jgi:hypothetical protein
MPRRSLVSVLVCYPALFIAVCFTQPHSGLAGDKAIDLSRATVVTRGDAAATAERTAATVLVEEVATRSGLNWRIASAWPKNGPVIVVTTGDDPAAWQHVRPAASAERLAKLGPDGFVVAVDSSVAEQPVVWLLGRDPRGAIFAVGHVLRKLAVGPGEVRCAQPIEIATAPAYALRGHQLGYRARANSWDAWDVRQFEQYIRELALCGANAVENIPFQDTDFSPHMKVPRAEMNVAMSKICQRYDLEYWLWTPAEFDLNDAQLRRRAIEQHAELYKACPRIDGVFFPGGDPGNNDPRLVLPFLADLYEVLKPHHPQAKMWLSLQWFNREQVDYAHNYINENQPAWLGGLVSGPSSPPIASTRKRLPARYPIRHYPDITHTVRCQYPVPWWDPAFAVTLGREPPNPQPLYEALLHNWFAPYTNGFLSYSDGIHDDVNKVVWTRLAWDPSADVREILIDYSRLFFGADVAEDAADGILALESNFQGPLRTNGGVNATLSHWRRLESQSPRLRDNWRWQLCLVRAYYDAYTRQRLIYESALEEEANTALAEAEKKGSAAAMNDASAILLRADQHCSPELRAKIVELCAALFRSIGLQTSVPIYQASGAERGCILDFLDHPLNNRWWLEDEFKRIRAMSTEAEKIARLRVIREWEHPGPGSFYDSVGDPGKSPHVVRGEGINTDPTMRTNPNPDFSWTDLGRSRRRLSWISSMDWPVAVKYDGVDPHGKYLVRATGYRDILLKINGQRVLPTVDGRGIGEVKEFAVPTKALREGKLTLTFDRPSEPNLNWREQSRLTEIWLLKQ